MVSYQLPLDDGSGAVTQEYLYPTGEVNLLVADLEGLEVAVDGLEHRSRPSRNCPTGVSSRADIVPGETIGVELSGALSANDVDPRAMGVVPATGASEQAAAAKAADPHGAVCGGDHRRIDGRRTGRGFRLVRAVRHARPKMSVAGRQKNVLISRIAKLDDQHERGEIDANDWVAQRDDLKRELLVVAGQLDQE